MTNEATRHSVELPANLFRLSRKRYNGFELPPLWAQGDGRFDDPRLLEVPESAEFGVLYCGVTEYASFIEILAGQRGHLETWSDVRQQTIMDVQERDALDADAETTAHTVSKDWQNDWSLSSTFVSSSAPLFDLTSGSAVQYLREHLSLLILALGLTDLDFSHVLSDNRELTRAISRWIWSMTNDSGEPFFSGIRYRSRFDPDCVCIALYQDRFQVEGDILSQPIIPQTPGFAEAASTLRLSIA